MQFLNHGQRALGEEYYGRNQPSIARLGLGTSREIFFILPDIGHRLRVHRASSLRNAVAGGPDQRISREHCDGIPTVYRLDTAPSTSAFAGPAGANRSRVVGSVWPLLRPFLCVAGCHAPMLSNGFLSANQSGSGFRPLMQRGWAWDRLATAGRLRPKALTVHIDSSDFR